MRLLRMNLLAISFSLLLIIILSWHAKAERSKIAILYMSKQESITNDYVVQWIAQTHNDIQTRLSNENLGIFKHFRIQPIKSEELPNLEDVNQIFNEQKLIHLIFGQGISTENGTEFVGAAYLGGAMVGGKLFSISQNINPNEYKSQRSVVILLSYYAMSQVSAKNTSEACRMLGMAYPITQILLNNSEESKKILTKMPDTNVVIREIMKELSNKKCSIP